MYHRLSLALAVLLTGLALSPAGAADESADEVPLPEGAGELDAPLPEGFPPPGPTDKVIVKEYPAYRLARVEGDNAFFKLFDHITKHEIAMTAPVEMTLEQADGDDEQGDDAALRMVDMAFLYRKADLGEAGKDGPVSVVDAPAQKVLSISVIGQINPQRLKEARAALDRALAERDDEYKAAGPVRVMGYHGPMTRREKRLYEVQLPIARTVAEAEADAGDAGDAAGKTGGETEAEGEGEGEGGGEAEGEAGPETSGQASGANAPPPGEPLRGRALLWAYIDADDDEAAALRQRLIAAEPDVGQVAAWLASSRPPRPVAERQTPWETITVTGIDNRKRTALLRVPEGFDAWDEQYPLIVELHGGVAYPKPRPIEEMKETNYSIVGGMVDKAFYLQPRGTRRALWFNKVGADNVLRAIREVRRRYPIDPNRIYLGGFSDGAHGSYYFAAAYPGLFAGILPLNGLPLAAQMGGDQLHFLNATNVPLYIVTTGRDQLFPPSLVEPFVEMLRKGGVDLKYTLYEKLPHAPLYMKEQTPKMTQWMANHPREPYPDELVWATAYVDRMPGLHWLKVDRIGDVGNNHAFKDVNLDSAAGRVRLGVQVDRAWDGAGVKVSRVDDDSFAEALGLKVGDVIVGMDGQKVAGFEPLARAIGRKSPGDKLALEIQRPGADEPLAFKGRFPKPAPRLAFKRDKPFGTIRATYRANRFDVQAQRVAAFSLGLSPHMVDMTEPITVSVNGQVVFEQKVTPTLAATLDWARRLTDPTQVYTATLTIEVPVKE